MAKPFDAAAKRLVEADPLAWLRYVGLPGTEAELIDADLTTVISEADRILHVRTPEYLAHIELQATYRRDMGDRVLLYGVLVYVKYSLPVQSVVVLLRKEADGPAITGQAGYQVPESPDGSVDMRYRVVRVWEKDADEVLHGPLATLPPAPLANVTEDDLPSIVKRMEARIAAEAPSEEVGMLWTTTFLLMGLKYDPEFTRQLLQGVMEMKESSTYQSILAEGREEGREEGELREARKILLRHATRRFGLPDAPTQQAIEDIASVEILETLIDRVADVESWSELLNANR